MKKLKSLQPGDIFTFAGERFVVLEHLADGTFVLTESPIGKSPFQKKDTDTRNDYSKSMAKDKVDKFVAELPRNSVEAAAILPFELDLRPTDQSNGYGTIEVRAAFLTLWQYGKYKEIIPLLDDGWWLATPLWTRWLRSPDTNYTLYVWLVYSDGGCGSGGASYSYGIRPALKLDAELLVSVDSDDDCDMDCENCTDWFDEVSERLRDCSCGDVWSDGDEILCRTESAADALADMFEQMYRSSGEDVLVNTGYYDPEDDKRSGETDRYTGWWYVHVG